MNISDINTLDFLYKVHFTIELLIQITYQSLIQIYLRKRYRTDRSNVSSANSCLI